MSRLLAEHKPEQYRMDADGGEVIIMKMTEELWQVMHDGLRAFIAGRVNDQGHVDDILQDVFVRVYRQLDTVRDPHRIIAWIYQVTRNAIIDHYRKPGRQREVPSGLSSELEVLHEAPAISEMTRQGDATELRAELAGCLRPMIERLSQDYRDAITLVEIEGLTQQIAAKQMGISLSGMKSRIQRGRGQLKQMLNDCCVIELDGRKGIVEYHSRRAECDPCVPNKNMPETDL
ncbi:MAG TPA: RNA polymerase sigma factor SigZ [Nitrospira sp.]|nr:RNA polymerase sigma factor SigZ [Nitrospira sp.]